MKKWKLVIFSWIAFAFGAGVWFGSPKTANMASADTFSKTEIQNIVSGARAKIDGLYDVDAVGLENKISQVNAYLSASNMDMATQTAYEIMAMSVEGKPVTARAVWHRPTEKSLAELTASLDTYKEIGVNLVFVETFYHGMSMFKSDYFDYYGSFHTANYGQYEDYLHAFTALATERGIETHAWVENFYVGVNPSLKLLQDHPTWVMHNNEVTGTGENRTLTYIQRSESGYIFLDPANKNVCNHLIGYYQELLRKNPLIKGINLDYIRYPISTQSTDTGYSIYAMYGFAQTLGRGNELNPFAPLIDVYDDFQGILNGNYTKWCEYRTGLITDFVKRVRMEVKGDSDLTLSTAVFSSLDESVGKKKQDWKTWFENGWIDVATPMAYLDTPSQIQNAVQNMIAVAGENSYYYTGLASSYRGFPAYHNVTQIQASYDGGANGYAIFCATQVLGMSDVQQMLKYSSQGKQAVLPHADVKTVLQAYAGALTRRADEIYIPKGAMSTAQKTALLDEWNDIVAMDGSSAQGIEQIRQAVNRLQTQGYDAYASGQAKLRIAELIEDCLAVLTVKVNLQTERETAFPLPPPLPEDSTSSDAVDSSVQPETSDEESANESVEQSPKEQGTGTSQNGGCGARMQGVATLIAIGLVLVALYQRKHTIE